MDKRCTRCGQTKPLIEFFANKASPDGKMAACKVCKKAALLAWRAKNAARWRAYVREEQKRPHRAARRRAQAVLPETRRRTVERERAPQRIAQKKAYWRANPERAVIWNARKNAKRRAAVSVANGRVTAAEWAEIKRRHRYRCLYCGKKKKLTMDHRTAISRGGKHVASNIAPACAHCNSTKRTRDDIEFARAMGRLVF